ncbi:hypothetical protein [Roseivirga sp. E12]|uniref:hypothetical protein n=1 Tax=Roseivirga sp. E12 TaxID=2819237 RepID=UPI001ABC5FF7|nr:hypothetical protein [Roseivirga sp. E12]MBO3697189.1 hypothetical protein [Roseivirga sp. E12]
MKRLTMLITLLAIIGFTSCEQINPQADGTASGSDVQVTQGDTMGGDDNENDDNDDDNDD